MGYVIEGSGRVFIEDMLINPNKDDLIFIEPKEKYYSQWQYSQNPYEFSLYQLNG